MFTLLFLLITIHHSPFTSTASAATSSTLNFQGRLLTNTGSLVPDGSYNIEFKIYDDALAGSNLWTENRTGANTLTVKNGYFSAYLGSVTPFGDSIPWDQELWMTMNVEGDGEMTPRFKLTAVPYAFRAGALVDASGNAKTADDFAQLAPSNVQAVNSALAALRLNQSGAGSLLQLQGDGADVFTVSKTGATTIAGGLTLGTNTPTTVGQTTTGAAGQTADLAQFKTSDGTTLFGVTANGSLQQRQGVDPVVMGGINLGADSRTIDVSGRFAYTGTYTNGIDDEFQVIDTSNPAAPFLVSTLDFPDTVRAVRVDGRYAYIGTFNTGDDFHVVDISDPSNPVQVGSIEMSGSVLSIEVSGRYAYITTAFGGNDFHIINLADPTNPVEVGGLALPSSGVAVDVSGRFAYVGSGSAGNDLHIIDVSNTANPIEVGSVDLGGTVRDLSVSGRYVFTVIDSAIGVFNITDIVDPANPVVVPSSISLPDGGSSIEIIGRYAYVGTHEIGDDFHVIDLSGPLGSVEVASINMPASVQAIKISGTVAYVATDLNGASNGFHMINLGGADLTVADIGAIKTETIQVQKSAIINNTLSVGNGLNVGFGGVRSSGGLSVSGVSILHGTVTVGALGAADNSNYLCLNSTLQIATCSGSPGGAEGAFVQGGNTVGANAVLGTNDTFDLLLETDGVERVRIDTTGNVGIGTSIPLERLDVNGGIRLGNTINANAGTLRWNGVDFEGYNGTEWVSLTSGSGGGSLTFDAFYAYDAIGNIDVSAGFTDLTLDTEVKEDTGFTHAVDGATVTLADAGWYEISYNVSTYTSTGGNNSGTAETKLLVDSGGGFTDIAGSFGYSSVSTGPTDGNIAVNITREFTAGDIVKLQARRSSGSSNVLTRPSSVGVTIRKVVGAGAGSGPTNAFEQNGNSFGVTAALGTTDTQGLNFITDNTTRVLIDAAGDVTVNRSLTVQNGLSVTGNSAITGTLTGLTGVTFASGNLDLNGGTINNSGDITGINGLTVASGGSGNLTLSSSSGLLVLNADTLRRTSTGTTTIDLLDSADTTLALSNSGTGVLNLTVEGSVSASSLTGVGTGLTALNAANITSGTLSDSILSGNVGLLNTAQTFSGLQNFSDGLVVGNTASATTGAIRWSGTDFEGYDGTAWVSLTSGGGGGGSAPLLQGVLAFGKVAANGTALNIDGASVVRNSVGSYTVTLSTAAADANYTILLSLADGSGFNDPNIAVTSQSTTGFSIEIATGDNGTGADDLADRIWHFTLLDSNAVAGGGIVSSSAFVQNGNNFGTTAILGTTDNQGLSIVTNGSVALNIDNLGEATFQNGLNITNNLLVGGGLTVNSGVLTLGTTTLAGEVVINDGSNNTGTLETGALTANRIYVLPDADGTICLSSGNCAPTGNYAEIGGNTVTSNLELGTNNAFSLIFKTANVAQLTIDTSGNVNLANGALQTSGVTRLTTAGALQNIAGLTVTSGGANITGNSSVSGTLSVSNTLTVSSGGVTITLGGLNVIGGINNNNGGITNAGAVSGATTITASGNINTTAGGIQTNTITRLTNAGALQNISTITASGLISSTVGYSTNGANGISGSCTGGNDYMINFTFRGGILTAGQCRQTGGLSDARLKENVVSLNSSILDNIGLVNTVNFDFKCEDPAYAELLLDCDTQTGVIAQELAAIFPELVYQGDDGFYRVDYDSLNIYTLKAVSELSKTINSIGDVNARTVSTNSTVRLTEDGRLQNINGLSLMGGGASITGGINNNNGGLSAVGNVLGAWSVEARELTLDAQTDGTVLQIIRNGEGTFSLNGDGSLGLRVDSSSAFKVQSRAGLDLFSVNTEGGIVQIGGQNSSPSAILFVLAKKNTAGDPVGVNGAQYYNEFSQRFRCYQDDQWVDCVPAAVTEYILLSSPAAWPMASEEAELPNAGRTWLDLRTAREARVIISVSTASVANANCRVQFQLEGSTAWESLFSDNQTIRIDETGAIRGAWSAIAPAARGASEVQVRTVCAGGDGTTEVSLSSVRLQLR